MAATVLLVDDDPDLLDVMGMLMEHEGLGYIAARSLAEVQALGSALATISVAILDVNLGPGQPTGLDVHDWLRAQGVRSRIVFVTGHAPDHPLVQETAGGAHLVLAKPIASSALVRVARGLE